MPIPEYAYIIALCKDAIVFTAPIESAEKTNKVDTRSITMNIFDSSLLRENVFHDGCFVNSKKTKRINGMNILPNVRIV